MVAFIKKCFAIRPEISTVKPEPLGPVKRFYYYFVVFTVLFTEFSYRMVSANDIPGWVRTLILLVSIIPLIVELYKKGHPSMPFKVALFFMVMLFASSFRDMQFKNNILMAVPIFVAYIISSTINFKQIAHIFVNIMTFLAVYSLVCFGILVFLPDVANSFPALYDHFSTTPAEIHNMGLSVVLTKAENFRNFGFAWEPGAFTILLGCALFCNINLYKKLHVWKTVVLTATIITTFSTMGYFVLAAIFFVAIRKHQKNIKYLKYVVVIAILSACVALLIPQIRHMVFFKLEGLFGSNRVETTQSRFNAITYMWDAFISSPLFGVGYKEFNRVNRWYCAGVATNTIMNWLAVNGVLLGVPCIYGYFRLISKAIKINHGTIFEVLVMIAAMVLMISTESLLRISFIYVLVFYGLQEHPFGRSTEVYYTKHIDSDISVISKKKVPEAIAKYEKKKEQIDNRVVCTNISSLEVGQERKKILFLAGMYYPRYSANGLCAKNVVDECVKQGYDVTCIVNDYYGVEGVSVIDGAKIYRIRPRFYDRITFWCERSNNKVISKIVGSMASIGNKIKNVIVAPFWPFNTPLYTSRFYQKAVRLYEKEFFDAVVCVYTPASSVMAGYRLKETYPNVTYIPYFLDALSAGYGPKTFSKKRTVKVGLKRENKIFKQADKIVVMKSTYKHHSNHNVRFKKKMVFLDVPMLNTVEQYQAQKQDDKIKLLYVGSLDARIRNPETLIKALNVLDNEKVSIEFVGNVTCKEMFAPLKEKYGDRLIFTGYIQHDELTEKIAEADVFVNVGNLVSTMVPSKIFEYMSYGKPIISTFDIENEPSAEYLCNYPLSILLDGKSSPEENAAKLRKFMVSSVGKTVNLESLYEVFYHNTPEAFVEEVLKDE